MPRYEAQCLNCEAGFDYIAPVSEYDHVPDCPLCGWRARKVISSAPTSFVKGRFEPFKSMVDGTVIRNQKDLEEHNRRNEVVLIRDGYDEAAVKDLPNRRKPVEIDKNELAHDVGAAIHAVTNGYRPTVQVQDDE